MHGVADCTSCTKVLCVQVSSRYGCKQLGCYIQGLLKKKKDFYILIVKSDANAAARR